MTAGSSCAGFRSMWRRPMRRQFMPRRQQGVALIVALLALVLAVLLAAALIDRGEATAARWRTGWRAEQGWQLLRGMETWAAAGLLADQRATGAVDSRDELWARDMPPVEIPGARLRGRLRDLGGCFNVNALAPLGLVDSQAQRRFERLLAGLQLPREIAAQAVDMVDSDTQPTPGGAEDAVMATRPPYGRTANGPVASASEMTRLPAMTPEAWQVLEPLLCALPADHRINLNTAPVELWLTVDDAVTPAMARRLVRADAGAFPDMAAVQAALQREGLAGVDLGAYAVESHYFLALADILADGLPLHYLSLLQRLPGEVRVIARAQGGVGLEVTDAHMTTGDAIGTGSGR